MRSGESSLGRRCVTKRSLEAERFSLERIRQIAEFRTALRAFQHRSERAARSCGLTPQRYLLLLLIKGAPDDSETLTMGELADRLKLSANSVTELANRAEDAGLVEREYSETDGRLTYLRVSAEGERRLQKALALSDGDRDELARAFDVLRAPLRHAVR